MQFTAQANATSGSWTSPYIYATTKTTVDELYRSSSYAEQIQAIDNNGRPHSYDGQVIYGKHIIFVQYTDQNNVQNWGVRSPTDQYFRRLSNVGISTALKLIPGTDTFIWRATTSDHGLMTTRQAWSVLIPTTRSDGLIVQAVTYKLDTTNARAWFTYTSGTTTRQRQVQSYAYSPSGRYMIAWIDYNYQVKLDLDQNTIQYIGYFPGSYYGGEKSNPLSAAIDDTGRYAYILGNKIVDTQDCGKNLTDYDIELGIDPNRTPSCPVTSLRSDITNKVGYYGYDSYYRWVDGDRNLEFFTRSYSSKASEPLTRVVLSLKPYDDSTLEYLALGDSYSSGEGDIDKKPDGTSYYTLDTSYNGGCHVSTRSYPFLLRDYYHYSKTHMQSVACSGAELQPDFMTTPQTYFGQGGHLGAVSDEERKAIQDSSLEAFVPGNVPQLEFVRRYKPNTITFTAGGNDIGFAKILMYCASPILENLVFTVNSDCGYADESSTLHSLLDDAIETQYQYTKLFIDYVKQVSPESKIIIIGYPSFVASTSMLPCALNSGALTSAEIKMINDEVEHMNTILRNVAHDENISFVDTADSLKGGRICEGSKYMTGLWDIGLDNVVNKNLQESFHPNHLGHQKIAQTIIGSGVMVGNTSIPSIASIPDSPGKLTYQTNNTISGSIIYTGNPSTDLESNAYSFAPNSTVTATMYSDTISLGSYITQTDGSLAGTITSSGLPIGRHILVLNGASFSGEPVRYYQFIEVRASPSDADGDGIPDASDPCMYIQHWFNESDGHDICNQSTKEDSTQVTAVPVQLAGKAYPIGTPEPVSGASNHEPSSDNAKADKTYGDAILEKNDNALRVAAIVSGLILMVGGIVYASVKKQSKE